MRFKLICTFLVFISSCYKKSSPPTLDKLSSDNVTSSEDALIKSPDVAQIFECSDGSTINEVSYKNGDYCSKTNEECALKDGMTAGADGNCQATSVYCSSISLDFDDINKICVKAESASNEKKSVAGFIKYFNGFGGSEFQIALNGEPITIAQGANDFVFERYLDPNEDYEVTIVGSTACSVINGKGTVSNIDISGVEVHCSDRFKEVQLDVSGINKGISFKLNNSPEVQFVDGSNSPISLGSVVAGSPITIKPNVSEAIICDVTLLNESEDLYSYRANCSDTGELRVYLRVEGLIGQNFAAVLNRSTVLFPNVNGDHMFNVVLRSGESYSVDIQTQPNAQECVLEGNVGSLTDQNAVIIAKCSNIQGKTQESLSFQKSQIIETIKRNSSGASVIALGVDEKRSCFLIKVDFEDVDGGKEKAICSIDKSNGVINLRAELEDSDDADAICQSQCLIWNLGDFKIYDASVSRDKSEGLTKKNIVDVRDHMYCGLTGVTFKEIDSGGERAECRVISEDGKYRVVSELYKSSDSSAECSGSCIEFPPSSNLKLSDQKFVTQNNIKGDSVTTLVSENKNFCFLKSVSFEDIDEGGEPAQCSVYVDDGFWILKAYLGDTDDADAWCSAQCVSW